MECTGKLIDVMPDYINRKLNLTFEVDVPDAEQVEEIMQHEKLSIKAVKYREKRSLTANAYCWKLCDKIAAKLKSTKEDVYRTAIRQVGVFDDVSATAEAAEHFMEGWEHNGTGWFAEVVDNVAARKTIRLYYGSSTYDSKQMARLLDEIISYCKDVGVEHLPPDEIERMMAAWKG